MDPNEIGDPVAAAGRRRLERSREPKREEMNNATGGLDGGIAGPR